jgi:hypothetical protein
VRELEAADVKTIFQENFKEKIVVRNKIPTAHTLQIAFPLHMHPSSTAF